MSRSHGARRASAARSRNLADATRGGRSGVIFDIDTFAVHDGPGIRMAVYLKGCPLHCRWCHSPESIRPEPEIIHVRDQDKMCGASFTADEVVERAARMAPFFRHSGGGITLTGGEPTMQPDFAAAVLAGCRERGIHTAIETSGACEWETFERILGHTDLVLYDLKLIDDEAHRKWTGGSNRQTLANARRLAGRDMIVRLPLIPGITDTEDNVTAVCGFMKEAGLDCLELMPYNPSAAAKYEWLDAAYEIQGEPCDEQRIAKLKAMVCDMGLEPVGCAAGRDEEVSE